MSRESRSKFDANAALCGYRDRVAIADAFSSSPAYPMESWQCLDAPDMLPAGALRGSHTSPGNAWPRTVRRSWAFD